MLDFFTYLVYINLLLFVLILTYLGSIVKGYKLVTEYALTDNEKYSLNIFHYIALILISFVVAVRYEVGDDWGAYVRFFNYFRDLVYLPTGAQRIEIGYYWINKFSILIGTDFWMMFGIMGFLSWTFAFKSLPIRLIPFLIFFLFVDQYFFLSLNLVRQFAAMTIFLYSIRFIIERNLLFYTLAIIFASIFHVSALLLLVLYFLPYDKLYNQGFWLVMLLLTFLLSSSQTLLNIFINFFLKTAEFIPILSRYVGYFTSNRFFEFRPEVGLGYLFRLLVSFFILFYSYRVVEKNPKTKVYFVLVFIGICIYNLFFMVPMITRVNHYFLIIRSAVLAFISFHLFSTERKKGIVLVFMALYFFLFLVAIYNGSHKTTPYRTIFSEASLNY